MLGVAVVIITLIYQIAVARFFLVIHQQEGVGNSKSLDRIGDSFRYRPPNHPDIWPVPFASEDEEYGDQNRDRDVESIREYS